MPQDQALSRDAQARQGSPESRQRQVSLLDRVRESLMLADAAILLWVVTWIVVGAYVGYEIHQLAALSDTMITSSRALDDTSSALHAVGGVPFVGSTVTRLADDISVTASTVRTNASETRDSAHRLSYLLAACIMIVPSVPVLAFYVPFRINRWNDARVMRQALERGRDPRLLEEYLANRALTDLPFRTLARISTDPWRDVAEGRYAALAEAELKSLGMHRAF